jgi:hypothetical protein
MRISFKGSCGNCYKKFEAPHINQYLPIDNDSYCLDCRKKLDPEDRSEWIPSLYIGSNPEEGQANLLKLLNAWNEDMEGDNNYEYMIEIPKELR